MTERLRSGAYVNSNISAKMPNDLLSTRKTVVVLVIVVACFAVLLPKVFYPMLVGSANQRMKPSPIDKTTGCCDVISETDVNTIKIMSELCKSIIKRDDDTPLTGREIVSKCQSAVLETCGIDISAVLQEQVKLGQTVKQILDEVRSLNGSLCLKYNFGVSPWRLGVPHRVTIMPTSPNIKQERPLHIRSEKVHPAFMERGRAIPQPRVETAPPSRPAPRIIEGRPGPIPAMRPTMGGAGHVVPPPKQATSSNMSLIMPIYTVGIVLFFAYTVLKLVLKNQPEALYPPVDPDPHFRREVFEKSRGCSKVTRESVTNKLVVNAMSALLDEVDHEIESRRKTSEVADQGVVANGNVVNSNEEDQPTVKVLGMETTASCEGGKKWSRPDSPALPSSPPQAPEPAEPPQEIYLEGALPAQSHLLVADSATEAQNTTSEEDPAVVLAGKMTLSVISLDSSENGTDDSSNSGKKRAERSSSNVSEEFEKIEIEDQINDIIEEAHLITGLAKKQEEPNLLEELENELKKIEGENIITKLEQLEEPALLDIEEQIISDILKETGGNLPLEDFIAKEINESEKQQFENQIVDTNGIEVEEKPLESKPNNEKDLGDVEVKITEKDAEKTEEVSVAEENVLSGQDFPTSEKIAEKESEKNIVEALPAEVNTKKEDIISAEPVFDLDPLESVIASLTNKNVDLPTVDLHPKDTKPLEKQTETVTEEPAVKALTEDKTEAEVTQISPVDGSITEQVLTFVDKEKTNEEELRKEETQKELPGLKSETAQKEPSKDTIKKEVIDVIENRPQEEDILAKEKETFDKLNEAIADLSSELKSANDEDRETLEPNEAPEEEDEEIEYEEYEVSDNDEDVDEEIRNVDRVDRALVEQVNGDDHEQSKYITTSSATLAENEISDEENLQDEDEEEEIEEIIEYVTDDEEEVEEEEDEVLPANRNNVNHVHERPGTRQQH